MFENMGLLKAKKASKIAAEAKPREILKHLCDEIESYAKLGLTVAVFDISKSKVLVSDEILSRMKDLGYTVTVHTAKRQLRIEW